MARYYSHLDFIEIKEETTCVICKRKCKKKEEMGNMNVAADAERI